MKNRQKKWESILISGMGCWDLIFCLLLVISLSEMTPKSSGLVLFSVPKFKKAGICQLGLDEHHPG